jgi:hypothetical protein
MRFLYLLFLVGILNSGYAQESDFLDDIDIEEPKEVFAANQFKATRVVNSQSLLMLPKGILDFRVHHRFGAINSGAYALWGLDNAYTRLKFDYGLTEDVMIGIGRSGANKYYNGFIKANIIKQKKGEKNMPITLIYHGNIGYDGFRFPNKKRNEDNLSRLAYTNQLIVGSKMSSNLSLQLMPTFIHSNYSELPDDNQFFSMGFAGKYSLSNRVTLNMEYYYTPDDLKPEYNITNENDELIQKKYKNHIGIGFDIETGGHVFQLHLSNSQSMEELNFIGRNTADIFEGGLFFGFNISRAFQIK